MYGGFLSITDEAWEIDKSELTLTRELGSGQFGVRSRKERGFFTLGFCVLLLLLNNRTTCHQLLYGNSSLSV